MTIGSNEAVAMAEINKAASHYFAFSGWCANVSVFCSLAALLVFNEMRLKSAPFIGEIPPHLTGFRKIWQRDQLIFRACREHFGRRLIRAYWLTAGLGLLFLIASMPFSAAGLKYLYLEFVPKGALGPCIASPASTSQTSQALRK